MSVVSDDPCLAADLTGPDRNFYLLCWQDKGHEGPHRNDYYEWTNHSQPVAVVSPSSTVVPDMVKVDVAAAAFMHEPYGFGFASDVHARIEGEYLCSFVFDRQQLNHPEETE